MIIKEEDLKCVIDLKNNHDYTLRNEMSEDIKTIIEKSENGEIGWGEFIEKIRKVLNNGEGLANKYWSED